MAERRRKTKATDTFDVIVGFAEAANTIFEQLTGKNISTWLRELQQQPRELPPGGQQTTPSEPVMPLVDAYAIMGLPKNSSSDEVKERYKRLAIIYHPDKEGGYEEAMRLLNNAYDRIKGEKRQGG